MLEMLTNLVVIPAVIAGILALLAGKSSSVRLSSLFLILGVIAGFAACYAAISDIPGFPPSSSVQKIFYAPILAGALLILLYYGRGEEIGADAWLLPLAGAIGGAAWILERRIPRFDGIEWTIAATFLAALILIALTTLSRSTVTASSRVAHGAAAAGLGVALIFGGTATTGFFAIALAVSIGATILAEPIAMRVKIGPALAAAALVVIAPLAAQALFLTDVSPWALLPLPLCYLSVPIAHSLGWHSNDTLIGNIVFSVKLAFLAFPPAIAAAVISFTMGGGSPY